MDRQETNRENTKRHEIKKKKLYLLDSSNNTEENEEVKKKEVQRSWHADSLLGSILLKLFTP